MSKRFLVAVVLAALPAAGCRMCCPSYDYTSPTNPAESNCENAGMTRRGSAFTGYGYDDHGAYLVNDGVPVDGQLNGVEQIDAQPIDEGAVIEGQQLLDNRAGGDESEGVPASAEEILPPR
jgi:hypothetical protein